MEAALDATGKASIRRRKLPAEQVVWLVLGMALYSNRAITTVLGHLGLVEGDDNSIADSAVSKARYRLGSEPIKWLFERVAAAWSGKSAIGGYRGLSLYGIDGTHLRVPDSDENFEHFGKPGGRGGSNDAGYPQLRLVAVMNLANRLLSAVRVAPIATSEKELARALWDEIPDDSLVIADRGFLSYMTLLELIAYRDNRHFLFRLKSSTSFEVVERLSDGTILAKMNPSKDLKRAHNDVPGPIEVRIVEYQHPGGKPGRLATTLVDPELAPAEELIELYHDRWDLEIGFDEIKTHMRERAEALRSKKPDGVYQEVWAILLVYNLVRREMYMTAVEAEVPANRISFRMSLLYIRDFWTTGWMVSPGNIPRTLVQIREKLRGLILPKRRKERRYPRHVKIKMSNYARNRGTRGSKEPPAK
ncbi:MAG: IS4 family transposase [Deltaproteobacteria bacterium]